MTKVKVSRLSFGGSMEKVSIEVEDFPEDILKADDWFSPQVGELCFVDGKIDVVKNIYWGDTRNGMFKPHLMYAFENKETNSSSAIRIEVKKGKVFIFNGKPFVHQEALCRGYIEKMARGNKIEEYEYKFVE